MEFRNYIGIVLIAVGTILFPIGWMYSRTLSVSGLFLFLIGLLVFMTNYYLQKGGNEKSGTTGTKERPFDNNDDPTVGDGGRKRNWDNPLDFGDDGYD